MILDIATFIRKMHLLDKATFPNARLVVEKIQLVGDRELEHYYLTQSYNVRGDGGLILKAVHKKLQTDAITKWKTLNKAGLYALTKPYENSYASLLIQTQNHKRIEEVFLIHHIERYQNEDNHEEWEIKIICRDITSINQPVFSHLKD